jgi:hypothetical protein
MQLGPRRLVFLLVALWVMLVIVFSDNLGRLFIFVFPLWGCFVLFALSKLSGWAKLAAKYRAGARPIGQTFNFQSGKVGGINFRGALTIIVNAEGLYLETIPIFHPPLFIPWRELHDLHNVEEWFVSFIAMEVGTSTITTLALPMEIIERRFVLRADEG